MRGKLQTLYDDFYYGFERIYNFHMQRLQTWKRFLGVKFSAEFHAAYKNDIRPYWARYALRPSRSIAKLIYTQDGGTIDHRYIPDDIWGRYVVPHFNDRRFSRLLADKNLNGVLFPDAKRPQTLLRGMSGRYCLDDFTPISHEEAIRLCATPGRWVIKPTLNSFGGRDVCFFEGTEDTQAAEKLLADYTATDFIVQRAIRQHPDLAALNSSSVNTVRIVTMVFRQQAHVLSAVVRIGASGSAVDNVGAGGYQVRILPDGTLNNQAYTHKDGRDRFTEQAENGTRFEGLSVPSWEKLRGTALSLAAKMPHLNLIAWDFSVDEAGDVILIEFNAFSPGQNQETNGPTFGDMTDEVLEEVFAGRIKKK